MSTITKDLGVVTAYGYYKAGGGTMTESEFTQFMVDFGTASKTATEAAQAALESENAARASEETATRKSNEASQSASAASSKAEEAAQSASDASTAKSDAVSAKTAAETAQGKAEDAQAAAESVAESIPSDYSQLSEDVSDLKEELSDLTNIFSIKTNPSYLTVWDQGYIAANGATGSSNNTCVTRPYYQFSSEKNITLKAADGYCFSIGEYSSNNILSYIGRVGEGNYTEYLLNNENGHYYRIQIKKVDSSQFTPSDLPETVFQYYFNYFTDKTLSIEGKAADAKEVGERFANEANKSVFNIRSQQRPNVLFDMQAGHGFYNPLSAGNAPSDDTTDYIYGNQSVFFNYTGQSSFDAINLSEMVMHVKLKVDTITSGASIVMYISDVSSMASCRAYTLYKSEPSNQFETGIWADVSVYASAGRIIGTPDLTKAKYIRFSVSNGSATYHIQSVGYRYAGRQKPCISFTFDDGWSEVMLGAKILGKYNIPATAYIFTGCQLTTNQLLSLKNDYGWDIELHGNSVFTEMTSEELATYIQQQQSYVRSNGLGNGQHMAYPGGQNNHDVVNVVRRFCETARTINMASSYHETVPPSMPYNLRAMTGIGASGQSVANVKKYIDKTVERNAWLILVFHRIGDTATSMFCSEADLDAIAQYAVASGADIKTVADMWERN